jgi:lipopolysaccharide transport system ATP-binding protein
MLPVLQIEDLSKRYQLTQGSPRGAYGYRTLRDDLAEAVRAPFAALRKRLARARDEEFWALRGVNLEIGEGDVVGIIGRNGAGKSTLLKILSRITKPTTGEVRLRGRVGSLLEVGTGFHPELTGRENIFMNGAILGMKRQEICRKFDEIVQFAEVEQFLDTPVKRYSSGMYVRLAFAVAAHLEPEILIIDEVLAVGDLAFQRKCMRRMSEVGKSGCTVLFVSHNMPAIETLCTRAVLLDGGRVVGQGDVPDMIREYYRRTMSAEGDFGGTALTAPRPHAQKQVFLSVTLVDDQGAPTNYLPLSGQFRLRLGLDAGGGIDDPIVGIGIDDTLGQRLLTIHTPRTRGAMERVEGRCEIECRSPQFPLAPGDYWVKVALSVQGQEVDSVDRALHFTVVNGDAFGEGRGFTRGLCVAPSVWGLTASGAGLAQELQA